MHQPTFAVLLAAGRGKRLRPYTDTTPKPLLPIDGRPTLDYALRALKAANIWRVCIVTNYLEDQIFDFVGDGSNWGLEARFSHQSFRLGTADGLRVAFKAVGDWVENGQSLLVTATDYVFPQGYLADLVAAHGQNSANISISMRKVPQAQLASRSSIAFGAGNFVQAIVEKPPAGTAPSPYSAFLLYILPQSVGYFLKDMQASPRGEYELPSIVNRMIGSGYKAVAVEQAPLREWTIEHDAPK